MSQSSLPKIQSIWDVTVSKGVVREVRTGVRLAVQVDGEGGISTLQKTEVAKDDQRDKAKSEASNSNASRSSQKRSSSPRAESTHRQKIAKKEELESPDFGSLVQKMLRAVRRVKLQDTKEQSPRTPRRSRSSSQRPCTNGLEAMGSMGCSNQETSNTPTKSQPTLEGCATHTNLPKPTRT